MALGASNAALLAHHDDGSEIIVQAFGRRLVLVHDRDAGCVAIVGDKEAPDQSGIAIELRPTAHKTAPDKSEPSAEIAGANGVRDGPPRLHDFPEAQAILKCSRQTLYRLIDSDDLHLVKIRNKSLLAGLEALIARQLAS